MYPPLPERLTDLVPLPDCDGPKLAPFDFQGGPQAIEFLDQLGAGAHSVVFKVRILKEIYALKLFRFADDKDFYGPYDVSIYPNDKEILSAFYPYLEPFSAECRAFGRLQEAGHDKLALPCYGYLLLDEKHEQIMNQQFGHERLSFSFSQEDKGDRRMRLASESGKLPPIRGIVKKYGQCDGLLSTETARSILQDIKQIQQLGIVCLDVAAEQIVDGKLADFSTALTIPHFATNPELNPRLTAKEISLIERETFGLALWDYLVFDGMVEEYNEMKRNKKKKIHVCSFPSGNREPARYNLRSQASRGDDIFTFVDPRKVNNHILAAAAPGKKAAKSTRKNSRRAPTNPQRSRQGRPTGVSSRKAWQLDLDPPRWNYPAGNGLFKAVPQGMIGFDLYWKFDDGLLFPMLQGDFIDEMLVNRNAVRIKKKQEARARARLEDDGGVPGHQEVVP